MKTFENPIYSCKRRLMYALKEIESSHEEVALLEKKHKLLEMRIELRDARISVLENAIDKGWKPMTVEFVEEIIK